MTLSGISKRRVKNRPAEGNQHTIGMLIVSRVCLYLQDFIGATFNVGAVGGRLRVMQIEKQL